MRLMRWVEGRISGRKSRQKDGSTTSVDDQFVYHPSPFRQQLAHIATPAHNPPPKLHYQLEQRLNDQLKERLSGHFTHTQLNPKSSKQQSVQLRRTASALESRSKPKKLFNRASEYNALDKHSQFDPYSQPDKIFENVYEHTYESNSFDRNFMNENQNSANYQNRYSSITQASNESAFFDFSSPSLATTQECCNTPLDKQRRSRIKTNPWLPSPWMSTNSITNSINNSLNSNRSKNNNDEPNQHNQYNQLETAKNHHVAIDQTRPNNCMTNNELNKTVRNSFSFASTTSTDSGCIGVNTSSMDASILSTATNFNESLMSCSMMTANLFGNEDEEILTISHDNGEQVVNQMNMRNYIEQMNYNDDLKANSSNINNVPMSSTCEDFSEMSSRAESQLSAIYQQIDELKSKIDEIDLDNGRIEARMNSLVNFNNQNPKVNLGVKKNNFNNGYNVNHFRLSNQSNYKKSSAIPKTNQTKTNYMASNSSEEENNVTSSSYSPASSSSMSSPTSIQHSNSTMNSANNCELNYNKQMNKLLDPTNAMTSSSSFNSSISTNPPSSNWSLASICSSQNIPPSTTGCLMSSLSIAEERNSMSTIEENKLIENDKLDKDTRQYENTFSYLNQTDSSKLYTQLKYQKMLNGSTSVMNRRKSFGNSNSKFLRRSFEQQQNVNRLSNGSLKNCNEAWVSTTTDLLSSSDEEEDKTLNFVNNNYNCNEHNRLRLPKFESKILKPREISIKTNNQIERRTVKPTSSNNYEFKLNSKLDLEHSKSNKPMLLPDSTMNLNSDRDALKFVNNLNSFNELDDSNRSRQQESKTTKTRSQIPKPLTPFKTNNYKRLRPIKNSRIPIMKEAINENDVYDASNSILADHLYEQPPSPAPLDRHVNRIDTPFQITKPKNMPAKPSQLRLNYNESYLVSPLTQQLKFEKEQRKLNGSFRKPSNYQCYQHQYTQYQKGSDLLSPPDSGLELLNSSEESYSDHSPLVEQSKNQALSNQIQSLRLELRDFKVAINEVRKDEFI